MSIGSITERALRGDSFPDLDIIDCHCHPGNWYNYYSPSPTPDALLEDADRLGIKTLCVFPHASLSCDHNLGNDELLEMTEAYPQRLRGLMTVNLNKTNSLPEEFACYYSPKRIVGIKLHPSLHKYPINSPSFHLIADGIEKYGGFVLGHSWQDDPYSSIDMYKEIAESFPMVPIILAHAGGTAIGVAKALELVNNYEQVYLDTSGFEHSNTWIEDIVNLADTGKVLYGSDMGCHDIRYGFGRVVLADIDDKIKQKILGENCRQLFQKYPKKN